MMMVMVVFCCNLTYPSICLCLLFTAVLQLDITVTVFIVNKLSYHRDSARRRSLPEAPKHIQEGHVPFHFSSVGAQGWSN